MELSFEDALDLGFFTGSPTAAGAASAGELCFSPGGLGPLDDVLAPHAAGEDDAVLPDTLVQGGLCRLVCSRPLLTLRCLDPSHRSSCALCSEAPTDYRAVELVGDPGKARESAGKTEYGTPHP